MAETNEQEPITRDNVSRVPNPDAPGIPRWASVSDVYPQTSDYTRSVSLTGGVNVLDEPGYSFGVLLTQTSYEHADAPAETYADINLESESHDIPVLYAYRTAAAICLLARAYERNLPEPSKADVDRVESGIRQLLEGDVTPDQLRAIHKLKYSGLADETDFRRTLRDLLEAIYMSLDPEAKNITKVWEA